MQAANSRQQSTPMGLLNHSAPTEAASTDTPPRTDIESGTDIDIDIDIDRVTDSDSDSDSSAATGTTTTTTQVWSNATTTSTTPTTPTTQPAPPFGAFAPALPAQVHATLQAIEDGTRRLEAAVVTRNLAEVKSVLTELPLLLNTPLQGRSTALHIAVRQGDMRTLEFLLAQDAIDPNPVDEHGRSPLHVSISAGYTKVTDALLRHRNIQVDVRDNQGATPLFSAVGRADVQVAQQLLDKGADINACMTKGRTLLHFACATGRRHVVLWLLDPQRKLAPSSLNQRNGDGETPLVVAVKGDEHDAVEALLTHAAVDPNAMDPSGWTALHHAAVAGNLPSAQHLLRDGRTQVNASMPPSNATPFYAAVMGNELASAKLLREHGADIHASTNGGYTPLHLACHHGNLEAVTWLTDPQTSTRNADPAVLNAVDKKGLTALHVAALNGHHEVVAQLLTNSAVNPNTMDLNGWAPLHHAIREGHVDVVRALLNAPQTTPALHGPHGLNILHMLSLAPNAEALLDLIRLTLKPPELFEKLVNETDQWGAWPVSLAAQRSKGKAVIDALRPAVIATTPKPLEPTTYKRGWLIAGNDQDSWEERNLAAMGTKAGIKMKTYGNGTQNLSWEGLKKLPIREGDFVIFMAHAFWDETLQRVMFDLGNGESVPLVDVARLFYEKGALKVLFLGCEISMAMKPLMERFNNDPTMPRPADRDGGYQGLDITAVGREKETLTSLNLDAAQCGLQDCISALNGAPATALLTRSVQPLSTVQWHKTQRQLEMVQRGALTVAEFDKSLPPEEVQALKKSLMLMHVFDNDVEEVDALLTADKALLHTKTEHGMSMLHVACAEGHKATVEKLLQHGADIHQVDRQGASALHSACKFGHTKVVKMLLSAGANIHLPTSPSDHSFTPLQYACQNGSPEIVSLLLDAGASTTAKDTLGRTPLAYAQVWKHHDVVAVLEAHAKSHPPI